MLELAIALGLQIVKYGEEAVVDLESFSLEGPRMRSIRQTVRRAQREGGLPAPAAVARSPRP